MMIPGNNNKKKKILKKNIYWIKTSKKRLKKWQIEQLD